MGRARPASGLARRGNRRRHRLCRAKGPTQRSARMAACRGAGDLARRPLLRNARPDQVVSGPWMGLSPTAQGQPVDVDRIAQGDDGRSGTLGRALLPGRGTHRQARQHQHRRHPRCRARRAVDHRHVRRALLSPHARLFAPLGHRADVLRLQIARVRHPRNADPVSRPPRAFDPRDVARLIWAVSTGMWDAAENPTPNEKKDRSVNPENSPEASCPGLPEASAQLSDLCSKPCRCQNSGSVC